MFRIIEVAGIIGMDGKFLDENNRGGWNKHLDFVNKINIQGGWIFSRNFQNLTCSSFPASGFHEVLENVGV